jgi:hypothetical protein
MTIRSSALAAVLGIGAGAAAVSAQEPPLASQVIVDVRLSADGRAALTRNAGGTVRLWPALDGSREPVPLDAPGAGGLALAAAPGGGWRAALIDAAGGLHLAHVDPDGRSRVLVPATATSVLAAAFLPGAGLVTVGRDHALRLLDDAGAERARCERRAFPAVDLRVSIDGDRVVAIAAPDAGEGTAAVLAYQVSLPAARLVPAGDPVALAATGPRRTMAVSPDARRFFHLVGGRAEVVDLMTGARRPLPPVPGGAYAAGFVSDDDVVVLLPRGAWGTVHLGGGGFTPLPRNPAAGPRANDLAAGLHVGGHGGWLYTEPVVGGRRRFLGYDVVPTQRIALSPEGRFLAHAAGRTVVVEPVTGGAPFSVLQLSGGGGDLRELAFLDEDRVAVVDEAGVAHAIRWSTGQEMVSQPDAGGLPPPVDERLPSIPSFDRRGGRYYTEYDGAHVLVVERAGVVEKLRLPRAVYDVSPAPSGDTVLATGSPSTGLIIAYRTAGLTRLWSAAIGDVRDSAWSADGRRFAVLSGRTIVVLDAHTGAELRRVRGAVFRALDDAPAGASWAGAEDSEISHR